MRLAFIVGLVGGLLITGACGDDGVGGHEGDGGLMGEAGSSGRCHGGSLEDFCAKGFCPSSPDAAVEWICTREMFRGYHVETNTCGGKTVHRVIALSHTQYHFDASRKLIGVTQVGDTPVASCSENFVRYGKGCTGTNPPPQTTCEAADGGTDDAGS
jgi:hypothetical protein